VVVSQRTFEVREKNTKDRCGLIGVAKLDQPLGKAVLRRHGVDVVPAQCSRFVSQDCPGSPDGFRRITHLTNDVRDDTTGGESIHRERSEPLVPVRQNAPELP